MVSLSLVMKQLKCIEFPRPMCRIMMLKQNLSHFFFETCHKSFSNTSLYPFLSLSPSSPSPPIPSPALPSPALYSGLFGVMM